MLKIAFLVSLGIALVRAGIDYNDCHDEFGGYGQTVVCRSGYLPVRLCTSGSSSDCSGFYTRLRCCRETFVAAKPAVKACSLERGGFGDYVECASGRMAMQVCTSGGSADCGGVYTQISCCDDHSQTITSSCNWEHGNYGQTVQCQSGRVITGVCSSGASADCRMSGSAYTGIECCLLQ